MLDKHPWLVIPIFLSAFLPFLAGLVWVHSHFESKHFNEVTGGNTTTWDAVWLKLRVMEPSNAKAVNLRNPSSDDGVYFDVLMSGEWQTVYLEPDAILYLEWREVR